MIRIYSLERKFSKLEKKVKKSAMEILDFFSLEGADLEIFLVGDDEIKKINQRYRKKENATNILSFLPPKDFPKHYLKKSIGEIYLAPDFIFKEGSDIRRILLHGVLHLLGFNHEKRTDANKMEIKEKEAADVLGF